MAETIVTAVVVFVILQLATQSRVIEGTSMFPTLKSNERLLVNRFVYLRGSTSLFGEDGWIFRGPQRGDIVVFHPPTGSDTDFVKRVIAVPGDVVDVRNSRVFVNGREEHYSGQSTSSQGGAYPRTVPEGQYFVLGDNRAVSNDSRAWGFVPARDIIGRAWISYWPPSELGIFG